MSNILFLSYDMVLRLHGSLTECYGGSPGLRDEGMLRSAVATPAMTFGRDYVHADVFEMAAAYLYHLVMNHPFIDGNKRIGAASTFVFLKMNGIDIAPDEDGLVELTFGSGQEPGR